MNKKTYLPTVKYFSYTLLFILLLGVSLNTFGQGALPEATDSSSKSERVFELSEVSIKSAETQIKTRKIIENLISDQGINWLERNNDSILYMVDTSLITLKKTMVKTTSIRYLENKKLRLTIQQEKIESAKANLAEIVDDLSRSIAYISSESALWHNTLKVYEKDNYSPVITKRLQNVTAYLDSSIVLVSQKNEAVLAILDKNTELSIEIQEQMDLAIKSISDLESQLFSADHPSLFQLPFSNPEYWDISDKIRRFLSNDYYELQQYFQSNKINVWLTFAVFFMCLFVFIRKRKSFVVIQPGYGLLYRKNLLKIISRPVSASIIMALMFSLLLFSNRPSAFRDMSGYITIIPLWLLLRVLVDKRFYFMITAFAFLIIPYIIFVVLPPESIVFRFNLLLLSAIESILLFYFLYVSMPSLNVSKKLFSLLRFFAYLFFAFSVVGTIASIVGNIMLSEIMLLSVYISILVGGILFVSTMMINGLVLKAIDSESGQKLNFIKNNAEEVKTYLTRLISLASISYWVFILLSRLNINAIIYSAISGFLTTERSIGSVVFSFGTVITFFVVIYLSIVIANIVRAILADDVLNRVTLPKGMGHTIAVVVKYTLVTAGLFLAVSAAGMDFSSLTVIIGAFGVGIGFGLQTIFNNLVSGLILLFERPIQIGDTIEVGTLIGEVKSIGIRSSNVRTFDGAEVIVPNGNLISSEVVNWTLSDQRRRIEIIVGVSYSSDPHEVRDLLVEILDKRDDILKDPKAAVLFNVLGESSLDFRMLFWTANFGDWIRIKSEVIFDVFDILKQNNVEIPFPQRDIHVKSIEEVLKVKNEVSGLSTETKQ